MTGRVVLVGAGPGAPDLITLRGWRALQQADVVLYDSLVDPALLEGLAAERIHVGKRCGRHCAPQQEINEALIRLAREGKQVVRLKGGDSGVFARGGEEALALAAAGVELEVVPGVSSAIAAPELAGIPLTHRDLADSFVVLSAHPRPAGRPYSIPPYNPRTTVVILMGLSTVESWRDALLKAGYPRDLPLAFVAEASTPRQRVVPSTLEQATAAASGLSAPAVAVAGAVAALAATLAPLLDSVPPPPTPPAAGPCDYPVLLQVHGRPVLVVGGGPIADGRVRGLLERGATVRVVAPRTTAGLAALGRRGAVELVRREFREADLDGASLVVAATCDPRVNARVFAAAQARNLLVNAVDDLASCNFIVPAVVRRGDLVLTVCTGGASPALSARLRRWLERQIGPEHGELAALLGGLREHVAAQVPDLEERKALWYRLVDSDLLDLLQRGEIEEARCQAEALIADAAPIAAVRAREDRAALAQIRLPPR